jgi:chromate transporter
LKKNKNYKLLFEIFTTFFKIGLFTFGGGYAMIPIIEKEIVDKKKWVNRSQITNILTISQSMPGAIAINSSTFIGFKLKRRLGAFFATLGVILPSLIIITLIALFFDKFIENKIVQDFFYGVKPIVAALIFYAAYKISKNTIIDKITFFIFLISFILILLKINVIYLIILGAFLGNILYFSSKNLREKILKNIENNEIKINKENL